MANWSHKHYMVYFSDGLTPFTAGAGIFVFKNSASDPIVTCYLRLFFNDNPTDNANVTTCSPSPSGQYSDGNVCGENARKLKDGVIELVAGPLSTISDAKTGQEYVDSLAKNWAKANATTFEFGGKHAIGYPAGVGTSKTIDENNVVVHTYNYDYPASIWVVDDSTGTAYRLTGYIPLEDLAKIAQSLK